MRRLPCLACLLLLACGGPETREGALQGEVFWYEGDEKRTQSGLIVTLKEIGRTDDTNDLGVFRIALPQSYRPGRSVTLTVDKDGMAIYRPLEGRVEVSYDAGKLVEVELLRLGTKLFLKEDRIEKFVESVAMRPKPLMSVKVEVDFREELRNWAARYGFTPGQAREEVGRWIGDVKKNYGDNLRKLGLAAFAENRFAEAADRFRDRGTWGEEQLSEIRGERDILKEEEERLREETSQSFRLAGDAYYYSDQFDLAMNEYRRALEHVSKEEAALRWAATSVDLGNALSLQGDRTAGDPGVAALRNAIGVYREVLQVHTREVFPRHWAITQNNLGNALGLLGVRVEGEARDELLAEAVGIFRAALQVVTPEDLPQEWAMIQYNLGIALHGQGVQMGDDVAIGLLRAAADAYRRALRTYARGPYPYSWARTQRNLGITLSEQGIRSEGEEAAELLMRAIGAYRAALQVYTEENRPMEWSGVKNDLGNALKELGTRTGEEKGIELVAHATDAYRAALKVRTLESTPRQWAMTQNNLGVALQTLGNWIDGESGIERLTESVEIYQTVLKEIKREDSPRQWAMTQSNLGIALTSLWTRRGTDEGSKELAQAVDAFDQALQIYSRDKLLDQWALTAPALGFALEISDRFEEAAEIYRGYIEMKPDDRDVYSRLLSLLQERLHLYDESYRLIQEWIHRHPDDLTALTNLTESLFTTGRFAECRKHGGSLVPVVNTRTVHVLTGYEISSLLAEKKFEISFAKLSELIIKISEQSDDFRIEWNFHGTLHFVRNAATVAVVREELTLLFESLAADDRDGIVAGLRELAERLAASAKEVGD